MWPRVLSYPARHPYVDRLHGPVAQLVHRDVAPSCFGDHHDPDWLRAHSLDWDLAHIHFRHQQRSGDRLRAALLAHHGSGTPVVMTVHDLEDPHRPTGDRHALDLLARIGASVDVLTTFTRGARRAVERITGRSCLLIPHGALLNLRQRAHRRRDRHVLEGPGRPFLLHAGRVRPNLAWPEVIDAHRLSGTDRPLLITVAADRAGPLQTAAAGRRGVHVVTYAGSCVDANLERTIAGCHAMVLPYTHGSHSGLLELAADQGVPVLATAVGYLAEQAPVRSVRLRDGRPDVCDLAAAMREPPPPPVCDEVREAASRRLVGVHRRLYDLLLGRHPVAAAAAGC